MALPTIVRRAVQALNLGCRPRLSRVKGYPRAAFLGALLAPRELHSLLSEARRERRGVVLGDRVEWSGRATRVVLAGSRGHRQALAAADRAQAIRARWTAAIAAGPPELAAPTTTTAAAAAPLAALVAAAPLTRNVLARRFGVALELARSTGRTAAI